jgi:hypothetical protein
MAFRRSCAAQEPEQIRGQHGKIVARHASFWMNHKVAAHGNFRAMAADDFAHAPPDAVAHHGTAERFLNAKSKPARRLVIGAKKNCEVGTRPALTGTIDGVKLATPHQPCRARKLQARVTRA